MRTLYFLTAIAALALVPALSHAGSPGGLHILALPTASATMHEPIMKKFFDEFNLRNIATNCRDHSLQIERAYYDGSKIQVTGASAMKAMTSTVQHRQLGKKMAAFRHPDYASGFDAALIYDVQGDSMIFYGISQFADVKKYTSKIALKDVADMVKLTQAVCRAAARLPVQFND